MEIQAAILLVIVFFLMLAFSVPVSYSIIVSALVTIVAFLTPGFGVFVSAQKMVSGIDSFSLIAVPFFILAGLLMNSGGIAKRLINLALLVLGKVPGSLALTNIAGNAMFGSISGSGIAAATAIGGVMLPLEKEQKYDEGFAAAVNIATAPVGQLIPPTTAFIVFSAAGGGASVAALFMAGWIPGLLWAACCMVVAFFYARKQGYVIKRDKLTAKIVGKTIWDAIPSLFLVVIIIGGILSGKFTPTEASGVAVAYAFILSVFIDATSNVYFLKTYELINSQIKRMRIMSGECSEKRRKETIQEHLKITKCALKQDWDGASEAMKEHMHFSKNAIIELLFKGNEWSL